MRTLSWRERDENGRRPACAGRRDPRVPSPDPSEPGALVLLVAADDVPTARRSRLVRLALEVSVHPVVPDLDRAVVLEELDVAGDPARVDGRAAALHDLDAAADGRALHRDELVVLGLDVADD